MFLSREKTAAVTVPAREVVVVAEVVRRGGADHAQRL